MLIKEIFIVEQKVVTESNIDISINLRDFEGGKKSSRVLKVLKKYRLPNADFSDKDVFWKVKDMVTAEKIKADLYRNKINSTIFVDGAGVDEYG